MALVKDYFEKTKHYKEEYGEKTVVFMQVGSFFEVYGIQDPTSGKISGSSITEFSKICDLNIAEKNICVGDQNVVMAGFSLSMIDKYLRKMQDANYTVPVYTQDEQAKNTTRSLSGIYSPGTFFPVDSSKITNNIICIWVNVVNMKSSLLSKILKTEKAFTNDIIYCGVSNIDIYTGKSSIFEFQENYIKNPTTFDELERFVSIYNPSEVVIIGNIHEKEMELIVNYANIRCNSLHIISLKPDEKKETNFLKQAQNCEKQIYQKEVLNKFFPGKYENYTHLLEFYQKEYATQSYCFLLDFVYQHNPNLVNKISPPVFENCSDRLVLANHSLKQLNIIDDDNDYNGKYSSVEKMLNHCLTPMGKRRFSYDFLNPTTSKSYLQSEYDITSHILDIYDSINLEQMRNKMATIKDINKLNRQIIMKKISPKTLYQLWKNFYTIKDVFESLSNDINLMDYLEKYNNNIQNLSLYCQTLIDFLESNLNMKLCEGIDSIQNFETNFINPGINAELDSNNTLLTESFDILEAIQTYFNDCIGKTEKSKKSKSSDFVKLHETEKNNFSLVATKRRCVILKESMKNVLPENTVDLKYNSSKIFQFKFSKDTISFSLQSNSNDCITSTQINSLCKNITTVKQKLKDIINMVYIGILEKIEKFQNEIDSIIDFVTKLDVSMSKAFIARKYNYCRPSLHSDSELGKSFVDAKGLRHCLIEKIQQSEIYVTNDICLGKNDSKDGMLLYGTNAVGKTSLIRALGIAVIMAQAGIYVPCSQFVFNPYKYIFTRIIGNDNIFKGLSTFAVEMSELRTILRLADKDSLILGDELCSGTESISAQSIFVAGIQQLCNKQSSFIFATHLHEIVSYDEIKGLSDKVSLNHMEVIYDKERDELIYDRKLKDGPGTNMYGLEVCRSLNLPDDFLQLAHNIRMKYHPETSSILSFKTSHFNSKKIMGKCEMCDMAMGTEVHHLQHQSEADNDGFIRKPDGTVFHKNHPANLMTLCESCHNKMHHPQAKTEAEVEVKHKNTKTKTKSIKEKKQKNTMDKT
uniref:DNA mismatch repair proteins mutS family domain-containing protein n=1 Tax=viral metagenome TaxID=1070528 RepID=A0A6C0KTX0_9ZZZZ